MLLDKISSAQRAGLIRLLPFTYTAVWNPLAANAVTPVTTSFQNDADFVLVKQILTAMSAAGVPVVTPDYLYQLFDTGSGMSYMDAPVHVNNLFGIDAYHVFYLPEAQRFAGGSTIQSILTNQTAVAARVDIAYCGFKVYYKGSDRTLFDGQAF